MALAAGGMRQQTCCHGFDDPASKDPHSHSQPRPSSATGLGGSRVSSRDSRRISSLAPRHRSRSRATRATTARVRRTRSLGRLYIRVKSMSCFMELFALRPCGPLVVGVWTRWVRRLKRCERIMCWRGGVVVCSPAAHPWPCAGTKETPKNTESERPDANKRTHATHYTQATRSSKGGY